MERHHIDEKVYESLHDLEVNPPVEAWLAISDGMAKPGIRRLVVPFWRVAASLAALVAALFSLWFLVFDRLEGQDGLASMQPASHLRARGWDGGLQTGQQRPPAIERSSQRGLFTAASYNFRLEDPFMPAMGITGQRPIEHLADRGRGDRQIRTVDVSHPITRRQSHLQTAEETKEPGLLEFLSRIGNDKPAGISFGLHVSPGYNYRLLVTDETFSPHQVPFETLEEAILTYGLGLTAQFGLSPRWSVQTGASYRQVGQYVKDVMAYSHPANMPLFDQGRDGSLAFHPQTILTSHGSIRLTNLHFYFADLQSFRVLTNKQFIDDGDVRTLNKSAEGLTQLFTYLEVPVVFRYQLWRRHIGFQLKGGVSGTYLLENEVYLGHNTLSAPIGETFGVKQFNFSALGGFSMDIPVSSRLTLHLEPTAQVFLNPVQREGMMQGNAFPYSYTLQTGISYTW